MKDEIPSDQVGAVLAAHLEGLGRMERYEYPRAATAFRRVRELAPGWIPGSINLSIALLNDTGTRKEAAKKKGESENQSNFDEATQLLSDVIARDPKNPWAHFCRGVIEQFQGDIASAHADYKAVAEVDPSDGNTWYKIAETLPEPEERTPETIRAKARETIGLLEKALRCNPYLVPALYKIQGTYRVAGEGAKGAELMEAWKSLNPDNNVTAPGDTVKNFYGEPGRYSRIIDPVPSLIARSTTAGPPPRFEPPKAIDVALPPGCRWSTSADFVGPLATFGRARSRFGAAVASFDADLDGKQDLYLAAAVVGPKGVRDALLLNRGGGRFEDATVAAGLPEDRASLGVAAGDFDADRNVDLYLTGVGDNRLFRNLGRAKFADITASAKAAGPPAVCLMARWLDFDQDGDLDLYLVNYTSADQAADAFTERPVPGIANLAFRNDGVPPPSPNQQVANRWMPLANEPNDEKSGGGLSVVLTPWPDSSAFGGGIARHTGMTALYLDDDRDLDVVLTADGQAPAFVLNDRLGKFHAVAVEGPTAVDSSSGVIATDFDKDGRPDLVFLSANGPANAWRNASTRTVDGVKLALESWPANLSGWASATELDLDLDTWPDLLGLSSGGPSPAWSRGDGKRLASELMAIGPEAGEAGGRPMVGLAAVNLVGDPLPDLLLWREGSGPSIAANPGNGRRWLAIDLGGRWKTDFGFMRTNSHALGTRITLEGQGLLAPRDWIAPESGPAQSVGPILLGMGDRDSADLLRLRWPDGTMQCELNVTAGQLLSLAENNRKTGSCPVLFTWNGARFDCLGDFLGGGGLGYLVAPGVYGQPDRDEAVFIAPGQLRAEAGKYRVAVVEPMDELAYLDKLTLDVVDHPPGVSVALDERFAPEGPRPTGALVAFRQAIEPARSTDLAGVDVSRELHAFDRLTVDGFKKHLGWIGYAEEHGIVLDFADRLGRFGADARLILALGGWVEYPYSQTNYAAASAGTALKPPILERLQADGTWKVIEAGPGYPAGLPRLTTLDLTGKLTGPSCVIRLRTNMECYYDQAFIALREPEPGVRVTSLPVTRADLAYRGYLREVSPDGKLPLLYDHDYADPAPLARLDGKLTRYGDVSSLLAEDDDRLCLVGPGDEARVEFDASAVPPLPEGWTRSYVLRSIGYCKDADPFTAASDSVGPLPWKGMPAYPFGPAGERPLDPGYEMYLREYQTRPTGVR